MNQLDKKIWDQRAISEIAVLDLMQASISSNLPWTLVPRSESARTAELLGENNTTALDIENAERVRAICERTLT